MLAQHGVHDTAEAGQMIVHIALVCIPVSVLYFEYGREAVGVVLIRREDTEVLSFSVQLEDVTDVVGKVGSILAFLCTVCFGIECVVTEIRETQIAKQLTAVCVRVHTQSCIAGRAQSLDLRKYAAVLIEQFFRLVAAQPRFEHTEVLRLIHHNRYLMSQEVAFDTVAVYYLRTGPALRCTQNDHRPYRTGSVVVLASVLLDLFDLLDHDIHSLSHLAMHFHRLFAFYEVRLPAITMEEVGQFLLGQTAEDGRVSDLVSVQVKDRKNGTVAYRVDELVALPGSSQRAGLSLAVADYAGSDQFRVIKDSAACVSDGVTKLATFVDGTRSLRSTVARYAAREGELLEQFLHTFLVTGDIRIDLAVRSVNIIICNKEVSAVSRAGQKDHVQIITLDGTVAV